jgi:hypothetical protein
MKHFIKLALALFVALFMTACGNSPPSTAVDYTKAISAGNFDAAIAMMDPTMLVMGQEKAKAAFGMQKAMFDTMGGVSGVSVENEKIEGEIAQVTLKVQFGNGTSDNQLVVLKKIDGKWKVSGEM